MDDTQRAEMISNLAAAYGVVEAAFRQCSSAISAPLATMSSVLLRMAIERPGPGKLTIVDFCDIETASNGQMFWVPPGERNRLDRPQPNPANEKDWDLWLMLVGTMLSRLSVDPVMIRMDSELWMAGSDRKTRIIQTLEERFITIVEAIRSMATAEDTVIVTTEPRAAFSQDQLPFQGRIDIYCLAAAATPAR